MDKSLKERLLEITKSKGISIPKLAERVKIPKDRIYKWYQQGTNIKPADAIVIEKWINGYLLPQNEKIDPKESTTSPATPEPVVLTEAFLEILRANNAILDKIAKITDDNSKAHRDLAAANLVAQQVNLKLASAVEAQILKSPSSQEGVDFQKKQDFLEIGAQLDKDLEEEVKKKKRKHDGNPRIG